MNDEQKQFLAQLGKRLRSLREARGLSQEQLAALCGLDRTYVGGIERGERNFSVLKAMALAAALSVSIAEVFE